MYFPPEKVEATVNTRNVPKIRPRATPQKASPMKTDFLAMELEIKKGLTEMEKAMSTMDKHLAPTLNNLFKDLKLNDISARTNTEIILGAAQQFSLLSMPHYAATMTAEEYSKKLAHAASVGYGVARDVGNARLGKSVMDMMDEAEISNLAEHSADVIVEQAGDDYELWKAEGMYGSVEAIDKTPMPVGQGIRRRRGAREDEEADRVLRQTIDRKEQEKRNNFQKTKPASFTLLTGCFGKVFGLAHAADVVHRWTGEGSFSFLQNEHLHEESRLFRDFMQECVAKLEGEGDQKRKHMILSILGAFARGWYQTVDRWEYQYYDEGRPYSVEDVNRSLSSLKDAHTRNVDMMNVAQRTHLAREILQKSTDWNLGANQAIVQSLINDGHEHAVAKMYLQAMVDSQDKILEVSNILAETGSSASFTELVAERLDDDFKSLGILLPKLFNNGMADVQTLTKLEATTLANSLAKLFDVEFRGIAGISSPVNELIYSLGRVQVGAVADQKELQDVIGQGLESASQKLDYLSQQQSPWIRMPKEAMEIYFNSVNFDQKATNLILLRNYWDKDGWTQMLGNFMYWCMSWFGLHGNQPQRQVPPELLEGLAENNSNLWEWFTNYYVISGIASTGVSVGTVAYNHSEVVRTALLKLVQFLSKVMYSIYFISTVSWIAKEAFVYTTRGGPIKVIIDAVEVMVKGFLRMICAIQRGSSPLGEECTEWINEFYWTLSFITDVKTIFSFGIGGLGWVLGLWQLLSKLKALILIILPLTSPTILIGMGVATFATVSISYAAIKRDHLRGLYNFSFALGKYICLYPEFGVVFAQFTRLLLAGKLKTVLFGYTDEKELNSFVSKVNDAIMNMPKEGTLVKVSPDDESSRFMLQVFTSYLYERTEKQHGLLKSALYNSPFISTTDQLLKVINFKNQ